MLKTLTVAMALSLVAGCTAINHLESQRRMFEGVERVQAAERAALLGPAQPLRSGAAAERPNLYMSFESLRRALADDAKADIEAKGGMFEAVGPEDRISMLFRASIKGWHAGAPGEDAVKAAAEEGGKLCAALGANRPPRDCAILALAETLNALEASADSLLTVVILAKYSQLPKVADGGKTLGDILQHIHLIRFNLQALMDGLKDAQPDFQAWAKQENAVYACWAFAGFDAIIRLETAAGVTPDLVGNAIDALRGTADASPELTQLLAARDLSPQNVNGAHAAILGAVETNFPKAFAIKGPDLANSETRTNRAEACNSLVQSANEPIGG